MGQCFSAQEGQQSSKELTRSLHGRHVLRHFRVLKRLGKGSYGDVRNCPHGPTRAILPCLPASCLGGVH